MGPIIRDRRDLSLNRSFDMSLLVYLRVGEIQILTALHCRLTFRKRISERSIPDRTRDPIDQHGRIEFINTIISASACRHRTVFLTLSTPMYTGTSMYMSRSVQSSTSDDRQVPRHPYILPVTLPCICASNAVVPRICMWRHCHRQPAAAG